MYEQFWFTVPYRAYFTKLNIMTNYEIGIILSEKERGVEENSFMVKKNNTLGGVCALYTFESKKYKWTYYASF